MMREIRTVDGKVMYVLDRVQDDPLNDVFRCEVTGNPCGTDTHMFDNVCSCAQCEAWVEWMVRLKRDKPT